MGYPPQYGPPPRGETGRGLAVIALMVAGLLIGTVVAVSMVLDPPAQSSPPSATATADAPDPAESEEAVRQAAQAAFDAYANGRSGEFWDRWSSGARAVIDREEYVRLFRLCPQLVPGALFDIGDIVITGDTALVTAGRTTDPTPYDYDFVREDGSWRYVPPPEEQEEYRSKGVDQIAAERQAAGTCGAAAPVPAPTGPLPPG
ncbi:hypothetical protein GCM10010466_11530 [Planomonospora alba]|uniref:Uncharacterized protein n=1 Tax=Planomonospora alba TaxID=161354 RepID=A0ABP6MSG9_9ACTN